MLILALSECEKECGVYFFFLLLLLNKVYLASLFLGIFTVLPRCGGWLKLSNITTHSTLSPPFTSSSLVSLISDSPS